MEVTLNRDFIEREIRSALVETMDMSDATELDLDDSLYERGLASLSTVQLVLELEERLQVRFPDSALTPELCSSIRSLLGGVEAVMT